MSITKYKAERLGPPHIEAVEVEKETEACVWIRGRRIAKRSSYERYFDTWAEAKADLMQRAEEAIAHARRSLERANGYLGNVKGMKPPAEAA
jgi:hypothetical protein